MDDKYLKTARVTRFAKICCNVSLFCGIVVLLLGLMPVLKVIYYVFAAIFALAVLAAWLISLIVFHPFDITFLNDVFGGQVIFDRIQQFSLNFAPYLCAVAVVFGIVSIPLIMRDKAIKPTGRIVAASLGIGFAVIGIIALFLGVKQ